MTYISHPWIQACYLVVLRLFPLKKFNLVLGFLQCELEIDNIFCYTIMQDLIMLQKKHPQISLAKLLHNHDLIYLREGITEHSVPP